jgi:hypothetical protein
MLAETVVRQLEVGDCWEWTGYRNRDDYGVATVSGRQWLVHRYVYTVLVGAIKQGKVLDHLCRNRKCCNPDHLEPVTRGVNTQRGISGLAQRLRTHCPQGHAYAELGRIAPDGRRQCMECRRQWCRKYRQEKRKAA